MVKLFGRHLHNQIIIPLVLALGLVGIAATVVAVSLIDGIINDWIEQSVTATSSAATARLIDQGDSLVHSVKLASESTRLAEASAAGDVSAVSGQLVVANQSLRADNLMLLEPDGTVVASTGRLRLAPGDKPLAVEQRAQLGQRMDEPILARIGDQYAMSGFEPVRGPGGTTRTLVLSTILDDAYVARLAEGAGAALALYGPALTSLATSGPSALGGEELASTLEAGSPEISKALKSAAGVPSSEVLTVGDAEYRLFAERVAFAAAPQNGSVYLVTTVGTTVADKARATTTQLIVIWSTVAVFVLVGVGWWLARSVSRPLATLSEVSERVAEGDFAAKTEIKGSNEVTDLARNFNRMTDSLRDRSETLTKKVLELATLYEMSRSLGSTLDQERLLNSVLESALQIFDVEIGYVTMVNRETGVLELCAWTGTDLSRADEGMVRNSMSEWVIREGRPLIFNPQSDGDGESRSDGVAGALAALCVPLPSPEGTIGSITVGSRDPDKRFTSDDVRLLATIANHVTMAVGNIGLFSSVQEAYLATVRALAAAVDAKDPYTRGHSDGVAEYAISIGQAMNFAPEQMVALEMAAYLHDIGKIGISEDILLKPGKLTDVEMGQMRHHPLIGASILKPVAFPWPIAPIVRHHHEHYDGQGYPAGLRTEEIPVLARVLTVADSFEAMVADRPYRRGRSQQEAILELRRCSGTQFDPRIVDAFIEVLESSEGAVRTVHETDDEVGDDEAQAVYIATADGMFSGFRRLGGPRLASNLERTVNDRLREDGVPLVLKAGRLLPTDDASADDALTEHLSRALTIMAESMERASGAGLADHFIAEALETLPERMRVHAERLGLSSSG
jgi:HD-GYP domain-containing protein (c-di-GMP phosphodiesterase class II)